VLGVLVVFIVVERCDSPCDSDDVDDDELMLMLILIYLLTRCEHVFYLRHVITVPVLGIFCRKNGTENASDNTQALLLPFQSETANKFPTSTDIATQPALLLSKMSSSIGWWSWLSIFGHSVFVLFFCPKSCYGHYIFALWLLSFFLSIFFYSSPNLSGRRLDVYHTSTHGVALVRI